MRQMKTSARISPRYPLTDLSMAVLFAATVLILGTSDAGELALGVVLCAMLVVITLTDLDRRGIPNVVLLGAAIAAVAIVGGSDPPRLGNRGIASPAARGVLFFPPPAYPRGAGGGG